MGANGRGEDGPRDGVNIRIVKSLHIQHSLTSENIQTSVYSAV